MFFDLALAPTRALIYIIFAQPQYLITLTCQILIFLIIFKYLFYQIMPILAIRFNNQISNNEIAEIASYSFLCKVFQIHIFKDVIYCCLNGSWALGVLYSPGTVTTSRTKACPFDQGRFEFIGFTAELANTLYFIFVKWMIVPFYGASPSIRAVIRTKSPAAIFKPGRHNLKLFTAYFTNAFNALAPSALPLYTAHRIETFLRTIFPLSILGIRWSDFEYFTARLACFFYSLFETFADTLLGTKLTIVSSKFLAAPLAYFRFCCPMFIVTRPAIFRYSGFSPPASRACVIGTHCLTFKRCAPYRHSGCCRSNAGQQGRILNKNTGQTALLRQGLLYHVS